MQRRNGESKNQQPFEPGARQQPQVYTGSRLFIGDLSGNLHSGSNPNEVSPLAANSRYADSNREGWCRR